MIKSSPREGDEEWRKNVDKNRDVSHQDGQNLKHQGQIRSKMSEISVIKTTESTDKLAPISPKSSEILTIDPEIGSESLIRFLKTKVRVLQEDVDRLFQDNHQLMKENATSDKKIKDVTETKNQLQQALFHEQKRSENYMKLYDESKTQISSLITETGLLKKDLESANRVQKQSATNHNSVEIRLNKATGQLEKNKSLMEKMEQMHKESALKEQQRMDEVVAENKKLVKQKNDLLVGFKKQMMLIDVLKKQKIHLEAANVLQFTEDEFLKLLNWKSEQN